MQNAKYKMQMQKARLEKKEAYQQGSRKHCQRHNGPKALSALTNKYLYLKAEASTIFEIMVKMQLGFVKCKGKNYISYVNTSNSSEKFMYLE